jgi:hypothetical protein
LKGTLGRSFPPAFPGQQAQFGVAPQLPLHYRPKTRPETQQLLLRHRRKLPQRHLQQKEKEK